MTQHTASLQFWRCLVFIIAALCFVVPLEKAHALLVFSNVPANTNGGSTLNATEYKALLFTTGPDATEIASVVLGLNPITSTSIPSTAQVEISLWSTTLNGIILEPDVQLATTGLKPASMTNLQGLYTFEQAFSGGNFSMAALTSYALVLSSDAGGIKWANKNFTSPVGSYGFSHEGFRLSSDAGLNWISPPPTAVYNAVAMEVNVVPEPSTAILLCTFAGFIVLRLCNWNARAMCGRDSHRRATARRYWEGRPPA